MRRGESLGIRPAEAEAAPVDQPQQAHARERALWRTLDAMGIWPASGPTSRKSSTQESDECALPADFVPPASVLP